MADCPRCKAPLAAAATPDVTLNACARCGGVWLNPEATQTASSGLSPRTIETLIGIAANASIDADTTASIHCPGCLSPLSRTGLNGVQVNQCADHGTFFDRGELARVSRASGSATTSPTPAAPGAPAGFQAPPPMLIDAGQLQLSNQMSRPPARTSGMAIAGLVFAFLCPIIGLAIAWKAQRDIQMSGGTLKGEGLAMAGIVISVINMLLGVLMRFQS